jgi:hypothetical protein
MHPMIKNTPKTLILAAPALLLASILHAADYTYQGTGSYTAGANWQNNGDLTTGTVPGSADSAVIEGSSVVTLSDPTAQDITALTLQGASNATLNVSSGSTLNVSSGFVTNGNSIVDNNGLIAGNVFFDLNGTSAWNLAGTFDIRILRSAANADASINYTLTGLLDVSTDLRMNGSGATEGVITHTFDFSGGAYENSIILGGGGMDNSAFSFNLDGVAAGAYTIVSSAAGALVDFNGGFSFTNLGSGLAASINSSGNTVGDDLVLTIVPEPTTAALLLGFAALSIGCVARRR